MLRVLTQYHTLLRKSKAKATLASVCRYLGRLPLSHVQTLGSTMNLHQRYLHHPSQKHSAKLMIHCVTHE